MAARTIENPRQRLATILIAPLMSCSARLPVYVILIGAFVPDRPYVRGLTLLAMHLVGAVAAIFMLAIFRRTILRGPAVPFMMELPTYKWPCARTVADRLFSRGRAFLIRAGTVIFAMALVVWALCYFPHVDEGLEKSALGRAGHAIEPAVRPLGWDWKLAVATLASFPAREMIIAAMGTIYTVDGEEGLAERLRNEPGYSLPTALSVMVFFALCAQCGSTLAIIKRETNSWRWPIFVFTYMTVLAYSGALVTYQGTRALGL
jgi:ferrous iron transport protein B